MALRVLVIDRDLERAALVRHALAEADPELQIEVATGSGDLIVLLRAAIAAGVSAYIVDGLQPKRVKPILDVAVARFQAFEELRQELEVARTSLADRKLIDRAKGIIMTMRGLSEEEAYAMLRNKAMKEQKKLSEIARSIITAAELLQ